MACRTAAPATDAGAAPDLIDGRDGQVPPYDPPAFADAIEAFFARPAQDWPRISAAARATAKANDRAAASARFEALLHEAIAIRRWTSPSRTSPGDPSLRSSGAAGIPAKPTRPKRRRAASTAGAA